MVRRRTRLVAVQRHLFGEGPGFDLLAARSSFRTVGIGQHPVIVHTYRRRYENMVDAAVGLQRRIEIVERTVRRVTFLGGPVRIGEHARSGEGRIDMVVLVDVEIAREEHEFLRAAHFADLRHHQFGALLACLHADMVHMQVEEPEAALGLSV